MSTTEAASLGEAFTINVGDNFFEFAKQLYLGRSVHDAADASDCGITKGWRETDACGELANPRPAKMRRTCPTYRRDALSRAIRQLRTSGKPLDIEQASTFAEVQQGIDELRRWADACEFDAGFEMADARRELRNAAACLARVASAFMEVGNGSRPSHWFD